MHGFNPDAEMTPEAFKPLQDLLLAYDEERRKLSDPANAALQAQHIEQTVFDRDIPCEDNGPIKVDDSQPHPARVLKIPSLELYYPPEARHALSSGRVRVRADVDAAGCVVRSELIASAGDPVLDAAALRFAEHVDLRPATQDGVPVAVSVALPVNFVLRDPGVH
jgi:protein TonB